jgi:hypothetical protein
MVKSAWRANSETDSREQEKKYPHQDFHAVCPGA